MIRVSLSFLIMLGATAVAAAQGVVGAEYQLTVQPAKEPVPALKYQLAYELRDQTPGNAAVHYFRAVLVYRDKRGALEIEKRLEEAQKREKWLETPFKDWPRDEVRA